MMLNDDMVRYKWKTWFLAALVIIALEPQVVFEEIYALVYILIYEQVQSK